MEGVNGHRTLSAIVMVIIASGLSVVLVSGPAAANPIVVPPNEISSANPAIYLTFLSLINLPLDVLFFSAAALVAYWRLGNMTGRVLESTRSFLLTIVAVSAIIAVLGAGIDFICFYEKVTVPAEFSPTGQEYVYYDDVTSALRMAIAGILVFVSVALASRIGARLTMKASVGIAGVMASLNIGFWIIQDASAAELITMIALLSYFAVPVPLHLLAKWHRGMTNRAETTALAADSAVMD